MHPQRISFIDSDIYVEPGPFNYWRLIRRSIMVSALLAFTVWDAAWFFNVSAQPGFWDQDLGIVDGLKLMYLTAVAIVASVAVLAGAGRLIWDLWRW